MSLPWEITQKFNVLRDNTYQQIGLDKVDTMASLTRVFSKSDLAERNSKQELAKAIDEITLQVQQNKIDLMMKEFSFKDESIDSQAVESSL